MKTTTFASRLKVAFLTRPVPVGRIARRKTILGNDRLLELAKFLNTLPKKEFNFEAFVSDIEIDDGSGHDCGTVCGTVCCAIGWLPRVFPKHFRWYGHCRPERVGGGEIDDFFDLDDTAKYRDENGMLWSDFDRLFMRQGLYLNCDKWGTVTPKHVARAIRSFVASRPTGNRRKRT